MRCARQHRQQQAESSICKASPIKGSGGFAPQAVEIPSKLYPLLRNWITCGQVISNVFLSFSDLICCSVCRARIKFVNSSTGFSPLAGSSSLNRSLSATSSVDSVGQYSTSEVADLVGLKATQVRHYVRRDLLSPLRGRRGEYRFTFQDVVMLRSAKELLDAQVPVRRANRVLLDLKARNAQASRPLSSLRVQAEGTRVVVQEGNKAWDAESGQGTLPFLFDGSDTANPSDGSEKVATLSLFGADAEQGPNLTGQRDSSPQQTFDSPGYDLATRGHRPTNSLDQERRDTAKRLLETLRSSGLGNADDRSGADSESADTYAKDTNAKDTNSKDTNATKAEVAESDSLDGDLISVPEVGQLSSDDWYNLALDLEEADPGKAPAAYRQALAINPHNTDAQVNLGRLCQLKGDLKQARRHYKLALTHAPDHQLANYNMGTIYDELDEFDTACSYYSRASDIPDAHYNLARLFEVRGDELAALRHMREYRRLLEVDISGR